MSEWPIDYDRIIEERKQRNRPGDHVDMIDALIDIERAAANPPPLSVLDFPRMVLAHHRLGLLAALRASYA